MAKALSNHGNVSAFPEQFQSICAWFENFNPTEKLIVMYSLVYKVSLVETRFLLNVLEKRAQSEPHEPAGMALEKEANDGDYIASLSNAPTELAIRALLSHLPLLHPANTVALGMYMPVLEKMMQTTFENGAHRNDCMQLLSLAIVHPAVPPHQRTNFLRWQERLGGKNGQQFAAHQGMLPPPGAGQTGAGSNHYMVGLQGQVPPTCAWRPGDQYSVPPAPPPPRYSPNQLLSVQYGGGLDSRPPVRSTSMQMGAEMQHVDDGLDRAGMLRSQSLPMPMRSGLKSGVPDKVYADPPRSGMRDVPAWLKSLRLHKYQELFSELTYDEMLGLTDDVLAQRNVTVGARHKILLSIQKLRMRSDVLRRMLTDLESPGKLLTVINELRQILSTPIKPFSPPLNPSPTPSAESPAQEVASPLQSQATTAAVAPVPSPPHLQATAAPEVPETNGNGSSNRVSPSFDSSTSLGPPWSGSERQDTDIGVGAEGFERERDRTPAKTSMSSVSSTTSSCSSGSQHASDIAMSSPSPTNGFEQEDLPCLITEVIVKACNQLVSSCADEESCTSFLTILDKILCHEAFSIDARRQFFGLKQRCQVATRQAQRKVLHDSSRFLRGWQVPSNMSAMPGFHHPGHTVPMASSQSLPRSMAPANAAAAAANINITANRRRGFERQNARNSTVAAQQHGMPVVPGAVAVPPPPPPRTIVPPPITNPFGAPGSGRRSSGLAPVMIPDNDLASNNEVWATVDYSTNAAQVEDIGMPGAVVGGADMHMDGMLSTVMARGANPMGLAVNGIAPLPKYSSASDSYIENLCRSMTEHALDEHSERDQQ